MILVSGTVFVASVFLFLAFYLFFRRNDIELSQRAVAVMGRSSLSIREKELSAPISKRLLAPLLASASRLGSKMLPMEKETSLAEKIIKAGRPGGYTAKEFMAFKFILALCGPALAFLAGYLAGWEAAQHLITSAACAAIGWKLPDVYLQKKIKGRREEVEKNLPDVLDLITVSVEAGMGLDGALLKVVEKCKGVLASEFYIVLQECKMGKSRRDALRDMADRTGADDLSAFAGSLIMAEQLGINISNVLRLQSDQIRVKRRQRVEENAMKAPIKMIIPMVACVFPTIFVVLLGPAVISFYRMFLI